MRDYDAIDTLLVRAEAEAYAAEFHGFVCGQLCVSGKTDMELWKDFLDVQSDDDALVQLCYDEALQLISQTAEQLQAEEFGLQLLLPEDSTSIALRVEALVNWCHGFLNGYGLSEAQNRSGTAGECEEIIEDFTQICRLDLGNDAPEDDEQAFMELVEYARMGAIYIYEELQPALSRPEDLH